MAGNWSSFPFRTGSPIYLSDEVRASPRQWLLIQLKHQRPCILNRTLENPLVPVQYKSKGHSLASSDEQKEFDMSDSATANSTKRSSEPGQPGSTRERREPRNRRPREGVERPERQPRPHHEGGSGSDRETRGPREHRSENRDNREGGSRPGNGNRRRRGGRNRKPNANPPAARTRELLQEAELEQQPIQPLSELARKEKNEDWAGRATRQSGHLPPRAPKPPKPPRPAPKPPETAEEIRLATDRLEESILQEIASIQEIHLFE